MAFLCGEKICVCNSEKKQLDVAFCYPTVEMQIVIGPKKNLFLECTRTTCFCGLLQKL
jgi:hypothetical protein